MVQVDSEYTYNITLVRRDFLHFRYRQLIPRHASCLVGKARHQKGCLKNLENSIMLRVRTNKKI